ncbi:helix-turn-helix domain-containing protein [Lacticaseibacillus kribbianus]|uniref:helix-turn-helix domain-containing protein n=1 Tax=Lacticaseibacillus kribbianus TaxID=2926292 RepID=UPI001CD6F595|nr:RodZ domain-containing protein [Lacticaseibacillus kribbianus]
MDEIGQKLRTARIEKGYTLDDLQQITKIQKRYLIAIEEGRFDALPGDFYVRAFIKQYAETVGLDADALLTQFQQDIPDTQPQEYAEQSVENTTRKTRAVVNNPAKKLRRHGFAIGILVLAVALIGVVYYVAWRAQAGDRQVIPTDSSSVAISSSKKTDTASSKKAASASKKAASASKKKAAESSSKKEATKLTIDVAASDTAQQTAAIKNLPASGNKLTIGAGTAAAWVALTVNNAVTWQATLPAGTSQEVDLPDGATTFSIRSGNMPQTTIKLNGTDVDTTTGTRIVRTITFTADPSTSESTGE